MINRCPNCRGPNPPHQKHECFENLHAANTRLGIENLRLRDEKERLEKWLTRRNELVVEQAKEIAMLREKLEASCNPNKQNESEKP